ncbi:MAG: TSUP family transporter, partial [Rhodothermaceae bacterium]|nr:TSUP family transporter [Rhodothermaceae bacterium]
MTILLLLIAGAVGGFVAGLVGVGGGIIFGPVLFFYFQALGLDDPILTPLVLGTSILCTGAASLSGTVAQHKAGAIDWRTAGIAGSFAAVAVTLMTLFVTTQPWYDKTVFQAVLGTILLVVVVRMLLKKAGRGNTLSTDGARRHLGFLSGIGASAGAVAAAGGVGGGVIMVPAFNGLVRLPLKVAAGTSTAAIVL